MECPVCGTGVMHSHWTIPLSLPMPGSQPELVKRDIIQAAHWAAVSRGHALEKYLRSVEGQPYNNCWTAAEVQQADQHAASNP